LLLRALAEESEVMSARDERRRGLHPRKIQGSLHPPYESLAERRSPKRDLIEIAAGEGVMASVKAWGRRLRRENVDVRGQELVDGPSQPLGLHRASHSQVGRLRRR